MKRTLLAAFFLAAATPVHADPAAVQRGLRLARANCARCHAIGAEGASPMAGAPPLRDLETLEPGRSTEEVFARALLQTHPDMPRFAIRDQDAADLLAWLATIRQPQAGDRPAR
jgi:mono/diheme cytochrome c family protein